MPPSLRPFMGATPFATGVTFRVWAPFARTVCVAGTFNNWSETTCPLFLETPGYWSADVSSAVVGDEYKFVIVNAQTGETLWRNDPYARAVVSSVGNSIVAELPAQLTLTPDYATPTWNDLVIYELHVGTFCFDSQNPVGRGTFASVVKKLPYLQDLGISAIQIMAPNEFAGDVSWGYNPSHIFAIESSYGGPNGFRAMVEAAHRLGIAVIFDVVYNHWGPSDLDLWRFDGWSEGDGGGIYFYNDWRGLTPWGAHNRPDYGRVEVRQFIRDNALRWVEQRQCDGLRWDATNFIRNVWGSDSAPQGDLPDGWSLMQWINDEVRTRQPGKISIAEDMQNNEWLTRSTASGGAGFNSQWSSFFLHTVRRALCVEADGDRDLQAVREALEQRYHGEALGRVIYTESHDEVANGKSRLPEEIWPGRADSWYSQKRSTLGAALVFSAPGIPMIFQGQEFLEDEYFRDDLELDWSKAERHAGIILLYHDLIHLRRNRGGVSRGLAGSQLHVYHVNHHDKLLAFHRWMDGGPGDDVVVVANFANRGYASYTLGFPRGGRWRVRFNSDWSGYSATFGGWPSYDTEANFPGLHQLPYSGTVGIGPYSVLILSQDN